MAAAQRADVTDKEQDDLERASDDSAIRFAHFDGNSVSVGEVKAISAYDIQGQGNAGGSTSSVMKHFDSGNVIGSHNDVLGRFDTPGKA